MAHLAKRRPHETLNVIQLREIALAALVDERTLKRALRGEAVLAMTRERIRRVLEARGQLQLLPAEPGPTKAA